MNKENILESKKVKRFLNSIKSKNTKIRYEYFITEYFMYVNENPDTYLVDDYEFLETRERKKLSKRYRENLQDFKSKLMNEPNKQGRDMKDPSIRTTLSCVKSLFTYFEIDLPIAFWKNLNNFRNNRTSVTETPSADEYRKILDNTDIQGKCIFLIMSTTGSRIESVLNLRRKDVDMNYEYPRIVFYYKNVKGGTTKVKRTTSECKHFLETYFSLNDFTPEGRLFRMTRQNADYKWKCALKKAGLYKLDENTGRCTMTTHCLKRYFITNFSKANFGNNEQWTDYFAEHRTDLDRRYKDYDENFIDERYAKGVPYLLVYERPVDADIRIIQMKKEYQQMKEDKDKLRRQLDMVVIKNDYNEQEFNKRLSAIEKNLNIYTDTNNSETIEKVDMISSALGEAFGLPKEQIKDFMNKGLANLQKSDKKELIDIVEKRDYSGLVKKVKDIKQ